MWPLLLLFYAVNVDICPCFSIGFPDLSHLIDMLKSEKDGLPDQNITKIFDSLSLRKINDNMGSDCTFTLHPLVKFHITTTLWIDETQSLHVMTCYRIQGSKDVLSQMLANPKTVAHKDIAKFLRNLFDEAGSVFAGWDKNSYFLVSSNRPEMPEGQEPSLLKIVVTRKLGHWKWPNKQ